MKATVIREFGPPGVLVPAEAPRPVPREGEVLVRVAATSVNPIDAKIRARGMGLAPDFPAVLHGDLSGLVEELGPGAGRFAAGDRVFGLSGTNRGPGGALAEFAAVDERLLAAAPRRLPLAEAAALPVAFLTAREGLLRGGAGRGARILVQGGAGGVGHAVLQLARAIGADIVATASDRHLDLLRESGAREAFDYRRPDLAAALAAAAGGEGFDLVFDTVGGASLDLAFRLARPGGGVTAIAARSAHDLSPLHAKGLRLDVVFTLLPLLTGRGREGVGEGLAAIAAAVDSGALAPRLEPRRFASAVAAEAHALLESGRAEGKILVTVDPSPA
ncbi:MAG: zinc-binding dehydrogenase [Spirochaetaceae bacterium]|nr:zinc-binding dehydrogenase [Spirochaetaceae bacterium]